MGRYWNTEEDNLLRELIAQYGKQWSVIATHIPNRTATQIAARWEKCINPKLTKGPFNADEDRMIIEFVEQHGCHAWPKITSVLPHRTPKQCRERWFNNLDPNVTKSPWTPEEDDLIFENFMKFGPKWSTIAHLIPGRTDNSIKNRWNASISKRVKVDSDGKKTLIPCKVRKYSKKNKLEQARPAALQIAPKPNIQDFQNIQKGIHPLNQQSVFGSLDMSDAPLSQPSTNSSPIPEPVVIGRTGGFLPPPLIIPPPQTSSINFNVECNVDYDNTDFGGDSVLPFGVSIGQHDFVQPFEYISCSSLLGDVTDDLSSPTSYKFGLPSPQLLSPTGSVPVFDDF
ncbi:hypothetical protein M9Y10_009511 [Tritrichomonas musculus]|uniref:Myb-like DNA-binding domain containing protein n=1 Tax=Tritrichomonas musculus TaxID=1915356 RepID=A0ABR2IPS5_9EUKA